MTAIDQTRRSCQHPCEPGAVHIWVSDGVKAGFVVCATAGTHSARITSSAAINGCSIGSLPTIAAPYSANI